MKILFYFSRALAIFSFAILLTINLKAQTNRRDTKKSVAYRANYQRISLGAEGGGNEIRNGTLWGWGYNGYGQVGDGTNTTRLNAVQIGKDSNWVSVSAGRGHRLGLKSNGTLWAWGSNYYGELGNSDTINQWSPIQIGNLNSWIYIAAGRFTSYGIKSDGTLWAWGDNYFGQLGDSTKKNRKSPVQIGKDNNWVSISTSESNVLGLKSNGNLYGWGRNDVGQLGDGTTSDKLTPFKIGTDNTWVKVSAGGAQTLGLKSDGTLWAWGGNYFGAVGDSTNTHRYNPVQIKKNAKWVNISAGLMHSFALKTDGTLWAWGYNNYGELGDGTYANRNSPKMIGADSNWIFISGLGQHSLGFKSDGKLMSWGQNKYGKVGDGTTTDRTSPVQIGYDYKWVSIATGAFHSIGLKADGSLLVWGSNNYGQLGDSTNTSHSKPVKIGKDDNWIGAVAGDNHSIGLKSNGTLWTWGYNGYGQLGDGSTTNRIVPVQVGTDKGWVSIAGGGNHSIGLKMDGTIWGWGYNANGQLGDGTTSDQKKPKQIGTDNSWVSTVAGSNHTLGLKSNGTLWAWGNNSSGQLGDGSTTSRTSPVQIGNDSNWVSIIAGGNHSLGLKSNGTLWAWGNNSNGQLGDSTTNNQISPKQIGKNNNWLFLSAGSTHTFGVKTNGTLWAWGYNSSGQLGDASNTQRIIPTQIGKDSVWVSIAAGGSHTVALKVNRKEFCATGLNSSGQLGDNTSTNSNVFVCNNYCIAPESPTVSNVSICKGNKVTLFASSYKGKIGWYSAATGGTYLGGGSSYTTPSLTVTSKYYVQDSTCSASAKRKEVLVTVNSYPNVTINASDTAVCQGFPVTLKGKGADSYSWSGGIKDSITFVPTSTTTFTVIGTNTTNCSDTATIKITVNKLPTVKAFAVDTIVCRRTFIKLYASGAINYNWSHGIKSGVNFIIDSTTVFTIVGYDANNCSDTDKIKITVKPLPNITAKSSDTVICKGKSVTLTGGGASSYVWLGGVKNGISFIPNVTSIYTVIGTDSKNCSDTARVKVIVNPLPIVIIIATDTIICTGTSVKMNGGGANAYSWSGGIKDGVSFIPITTTTYTVTGIDSNKCSNSASQKITVNSYLTVTVDASDTVVCKGNTVTLKGGGASTYKWSGGISNNVSFIPSSTATYIVIGSSGTSCSDTATIKITVNPLPTLKLITPQKYCCDYGNIALGSSTFGIPIGGSWSCRQNPAYINGYNFLTGQACDPNKSKAYTLIYTYQEPKTACINKDSTQFTIHTLPKIIAKASDTSICEGEMITMNGEGGISYTWSGGVKNGVPFIPSKINTSYFLEGKDTSNCFNRDTIKLSINSLPDVTTNLNGVTISSNQSGATYQWLDCNKSYTPISGETKQSYNATKNGDYAVKVELNNCYDTSDCITINTIGIINKIILNNKLTIYPNPNYGSFIIQSTGEGIYSIVNELGQVIQSLELNSSNKYTLNIENLSRGIYFIFGLNNNQMISQKVIVVK